MCNLYSITTNQEAIIRLFLRRHPLRRQPRSYAGRLSRLSGAGHPQHGDRHRVGYDALGHAAAEHRWAARDEHPQHNVAALAPVAQTENRCLVPFKSFAEYAPESRTRRRKRRTWCGSRRAITVRSARSLGSGRHSRVIAARSQSRSSDRIRYTAA
jgi:hypothetical protein